MEFFMFSKSIKIVCLMVVMLLSSPFNLVHASEKWVSVLAFFGTSVPEARASLEAIKNAYIKDGQNVIVAYTSDIIRNKLAKQGEKVFSVNAALNEAARMGASHIKVQSFHVGNAEEFLQLQRMILKNIAKQPKSVLLGYPLMSSGRDLLEVRDVLLQSFPKKRAKNEAVVLMGHGNHHGPGDIMLYALGKALQEKDPLVYVAAVEGSNTFEKVLENLKEKNIKKVWLQPFMIVAGDHAVNDMAGSEPDSWASQLKAAGIESKINLVGLGELAGIQNVFLRHTNDAYDDLTKSKKSD